MARRIAVCAVLALMLSLSACRCPSWMGGNKSGGAAGAQSGTVCVESPCTRGNDCTACYRDESDRDMGRLKDDLPDGGCCCDCPTPPVKHRKHKECCDEHGTH